MSLEKGSLTAPLFFLSLAIVAYGSFAGAVTVWALAALAMAVAGWAGGMASKPWTWLSLPVASFCALLVLNALVFSPAYSPAALFYALLLAMAFWVARGISDRAETALALAALCGGAILAVWGLWQVGWQGAARAQAFFLAPATYATIINLLLVPLLVAMLFGYRTRMLVATAVVLAGAVFAADSRGGFVALAAGLGTATILVMRANSWKPRALFMVAATLAIGWAATAALRALPQSAPHAQSPQAPEARADSSIARLELYTLSLDAWRERPFAGTGYLTFRNVLEKGRAQLPTFGETNDTWFVHNDYLQALQELGPLGLAALLGLAVLPPLLALRGMSDLSANDAVAAAAAASSLVAMAVHALVDFPFYIPLCLVMYGALLGVLDRRLPTRAMQAASATDPSPWRRAVRTGVWTVAAILFLRPVVAEQAAEEGLRKFAAGDGPRAAFWLGVAQRVEAANWRYHWYAGKFWDAQAADSGKADAARLAAGAYAAGFDANPLEVKNLLGMISVHRRYRDLLDAPANGALLQTWMAQAVTLAPFNRDVLGERAVLGAAK